MFSKTVVQGGFEKKQTNKQRDRKNNRRDNKLIHDEANEIKLGFSRVW